LQIYFQLSLFYDSFDKILFHKFNFLIPTKFNLKKKDFFKTMPHFKDNDELIIEESENQFTEEQIAGIYFSSVF
jgi:hypothetical protein